MVKVLLIALGGGIGTALRYLLSAAVHRAAGADFPVGTLVVNLIACLALGALMAWFNGVGADRLRIEWKLALTVGLLGGFSTFSTYAYESLALAQAGDLRAAGANIILSAALGLLAAWIGFRLVDRLMTE